MVTGMAKLIKTMWWFIGVVILCDMWLNVEGSLKMSPWHVISSALQNCQNIALDAYNEMRRSNDSRLYWFGRIYVIPTIFASTNLSVCTHFRRLRLIASDWHSARYLFTRLFLSSSPLVSHSHSFTFCLPNLIRSFGSSHLRKIPFRNFCVLNICYFKQVNSSTAVKMKIYLLIEPWKSSIPTI